MLDNIATFLAVAEAGSFTGAARALKVSPPAVSQRISRFEEQLGVVLFYRTTREVALTEVGARLHRQCAPAVSVLEDAVDQAKSLSSSPRGNLRLSVPSIAVRPIVAPLLEVIDQDFPDIAVELSVDDAFVDVVAGDFDAGIRLGGEVDEDMVIVRASPPANGSVVASPDYLRENGRPETLDELQAHTCIGFRMPEAQRTYRWEFIRDSEEIALEVSSRWMVDDAELMLTLARRGLGLTYAMDFVAAPLVEAGELEFVLEEYSREFRGFFLYFPRQARKLGKMRALISALETVRERLDGER
jgi:DNA-binding transcriptional LysR family regulator